METTGRIKAEIFDEFMLVMLVLYFVSRELYRVVIKSENNGRVLWQRQNKIAYISTFNIRRRFEGLTLFIWKYFLT